MAGFFATGPFWVLFVFKSLLSILVFDIYWILNSIIGICEWTNESTKSMGFSVIISNVILKKSGNLITQWISDQFASDVGLA